MKFETEYIEKLAKIITDNELTEISLEDGEQAITIRKDLPEVISAPVAHAPVVSAAPAPAPSGETKPEVKRGNAIVSPMVGMFYAKPSPDEEPFVKVGDTVSEGDIVCIIEAMKMMNEIESEFSGKIVEICVADGEPVEYGQPIMYVE
ncbi:MAG: acetyl-CoA carboxylase biotin carboxyl carrier protein [Cyanobacteria bacterium RUI128]|nr:acetyl-CoA carboxylase biotin carboxyl carrier protein [Cyanobacteria bacterium RUI128]